MFALLFLVALIAPQTTQAQAQRCFPETGKCISGVIRSYWENNGGLAVFGYPITDLTTETNAEGFTGPTQWFERDRLEDHTAEGKGVLAGRLGAQKLAMEGRPWETLPKVSGAPAGCRFFPETGHSLCQPFLAYWESNGGLARFGYPISEPVTERNADGYTGNFQWFERRRMEAHPENQPPYHILLGLLGKEVRAGGGSPPPPPPPPTDNACANIPAPTDARITPNCVRFGESLYVEVYGFDPNQQVGFWITHVETGNTVGTAQTVRVDGSGGLAGTIDTRDFGGYQLGPGNYVFVVRDAEPDSQGRIYPDSLAPFRVLP
jgi:hypothetical protein